MRVGLSGGRGGVSAAHLLLLLLLVAQTAADPISIGIGALALGAGGALFKFRDVLQCKLYECCNRPYIQPNFDAMASDMRDHLFGQHIVQETVVPALKAHLENKHPHKALVLSFHGFTGSGKNYVTMLIARNLYKKGLKSRFVHYFVATQDFSDKSRMAQYQKELRERIVEAGKACAISLFVFDEVDKMPEQLMHVVKPFADHYDNIGGVDYRRNVFVFLSNAGGSAVMQATLQQHQSGKVREQLKIANIEAMVSESAFNLPGGLKMSELISNHLIDHFIPFLPLERQHVAMCVRAYLTEQRRPDLADDKDAVNEILDELQYFPKNTPVFSSSGCKRVAHKANLLIEKRGGVSGKSDSLFDDDEL